MKKPRPEMRGGARKQEKAIKATPQSAGRGVAQKVCKMCKVLTGWYIPSGSHPQLLLPHGLPGLPIPPETVLCAYRLL